MFINIAIFVALSLIMVRNRSGKEWLFAIACTVAARLAVIACSIAAGWVHKELTKNFGCFLQAFLALRGASRRPLRYKGLRESKSNRS